MKFFVYLFMGVYIAGYFGNGLLLIFTEYKLLFGNWIEIINPFFQLEVLWNMITHMYFWIFLAITVVGYFSSVGADRLAKGGEQ